MSVVSNDVELGAMPESKGDDETIKITKFHLSDVNLLRHNNNVPKEQLEIPHTQEEHEDIEDLARRLFRNWDILGDGKISVGEITESGLDHEFAVALARVLDCDKSGSITLEDLTNCLTILKFGTMRAKVALLVSFMDREGNHQISYEEAALYMKVAPKEICQKLGLRPDKDLKYEDVLALFMNSDRGEDAINIFCQHILSTLKKRAPLTKSFLASQTALNVEMLKVYMDQLRKLHVSTIFYAALIAMQAALYEYNFTYYYERGMPYAFCIAKGFGMNLRILSIVIFLTMARTTMGLLYNIPFVKYFIPMGFNIQIHSFCGFCLVLHSFGHMIGHIVFHTTYVDGGFATTFEQKSLLTNSPWSQKGKGDAITGYILMGCLLAMAFTALKRGDGSQWYKRFSATHLLYNGWLIFVFLHVPNLWPYFVSIAGLMIIERAYDYFVQTTHSTLAMSRPCSNGVTFLSIPRPRKTAPGYPGSYYRIKVPALSMYEWHPFSLAGSVSSHHLTFFVASVGDWTRDLHKIVSDPELRKHTKIQV